MDKKAYYVGVDIGTDSIGWAVTDEEYHVLKHKGNAMWGVRLMEGGNTAEERRSFRSARRRAMRKRFRRQCLEMLFAQAVAERDVSFFQRLKESSFDQEDKTVEGTCSIFHDMSFTDREYHRAYPTIYHLRKELIENPQAHDVRLVYLALAHIIKNRGHFLFEDDPLAENGNHAFESVWTQLTGYLADVAEISIDCENRARIEQVLTDRSLTVSRKKDALCTALGITKKTAPQAVAVVTLLCGGTVKAKDLFATEEYEETQAKSICLKSGYDENEATYEAVFGDRLELIEKIKAVYDWALLSDVLKGESYLCCAKVKTYEKHAADLATLKSYVRTYCPEKYALIFKGNGSKNADYAAYSGHGGKGVTVQKRVTQEQFCDFLRKVLPKESAKDTFARMYEEIAAGTFMPKIVTKDNAVIPMQVNRAELTAILKNAAEYLPFLKEKDENGRSVSEKIEAIFSYRIPYYVGPLNRHSENSWVVRTEEKIYPWNIEQVVDLERSAECFIEKLTSKCTYLHREDVLPKQSLLYQAFTVLNELNNLRLDGDPLNRELKQAIFKDLFMKRNKVTAKALANYLKARGFGQVLISGLDGDFKSTLKSFTELEAYPLTLPQKEDVIKAITIFADDKKMLRKRLKARYGTVLSDEQITALSRLKYSGWGRLSRKMLLEIEALIPQTGEVTNIVRAMWETDRNLMQLLSADYTFSEAIRRENGEDAFTSLRREVEALYVSPKIKRPVYQTMQIIEEITKLRGNAPKKIFVEVARFEGEKGMRTLSRKQALLELYEACKKDEKELYEALYNTDESELRRDALYLYYTQFGRCMYTGKVIDLSQLYNRNVYDIDHIFPRSKIKDDSLDNRVLVCKEANEAKGSDYPITQNVRDAMGSFWAMLAAKELISPKKYERLKRAYPLTEEELSAFVARQLVETRQSTKAVAGLLARRYPDTKIEYVKAGLVSDFRQRYNMLKCREVNDLHHAKDAYLNIVVGNVYTVKARETYFLRDLQQGTCSMNRLFDYPIRGAWVTGGQDSMSVVRSTMNKNNIRFTRHAFTKTGALFDQTIQKKQHGQVPLKGSLPWSNIDKYGGFNKAAAAYFAFVESEDKKGGKIQSFEVVDLYDEASYRADPVAYITRKRALSSVRILIPCIKINTVLRLDGFPLHISGKSGGGRQLICKPAVQLVLGRLWEDYVKKIVNFQNKCAQLRSVPDITPHDGLTAEQNRQLYELLIDKCTQTVFRVKYDGIGKKLKKRRETFEGLAVVDQCYVLMQILQILHCNAMSGNLEKIGEAKNCGVILISNKLNVGSGTAELVHPSITGLHEQVVDLQKL